MSGSSPVVKRLWSSSSSSFSSSPAGPQSRPAGRRPVLFLLLILILFLFLVLFLVLVIVLVIVLVLVIDLKKEQWKRIDYDYDDEDDDEDENLSSLPRSPSSATLPYMRALPCLLMLAGALSAPASDKAALIRPLRYSGMADASGAVPVSSNLFVVADDESNALRLYRSDQGGPPLKEFDFNSFLEVRGKSLEADLEGAARLGDRAFWIGSHGRNRNAKERDNRCRLFATDIRVTGGSVTLVPVGRPYKRLLDDLFSDPRFDRFHLAEAASHAPKEDEALNIEGLSATPDGHLLIGFRNPIPEGKALLIPMLNPNDVIAEQSGKFGPPIQLDLGGLGIRDIALYQDVYLIIAGPYHGGGPFRLYRWKGQGSSPEEIKTEGFGSLHPEAIIIYPQLGLNEFQLLSDDGTRNTDGVPNRDLPFSKRTFRSIWVRP